MILNLLICILCCPCGRFPPLFHAIFCTSDLQIMKFNRTSFFSCPPRCLFSYDRSYAASSVRSSALKSQRFLEMASFSVIIASSDSLWSKERNHFENAMALWVWHFSLIRVLSLSKWRMWLCTWLSGECSRNSDCKNTTVTVELCGSHKWRKARPSVLGGKVTSWLLFPHSLSPQDI